jgi:hypothetical protein
MSMTTFRLRNPQMTNQEIADALGLNSKYVKQLSGTVNANLIDGYAVVAYRRGSLLRIDDGLRITAKSGPELCSAAEQFADRL